MLSTASPKDGITAQLVLREAYETQYGIHDHRSPDTNEFFALIAMRPQEDIVSYSMEMRYTARYRSYEIYKNYGLSLTEFFDLPFWKAEAILKMEDLRMEDTDRLHRKMEQAEKDRAERLASEEAAKSR